MCSRAFNLNLVSMTCASLLLLYKESAWVFESHARRMLNVRNSLKLESSGSCFKLLK